MAETLYQLAALDMDGTLLNTAHETSAYTRDVLRRAAEAGKIIALCTGRCLSELWSHFEVIPGVGYAICENGGCVYDVRRERILRQIAIPDAEAARILRLTERYDVCVQCFLENQSYMQLKNLRELDRYHISDFAGVFESGSMFVGNLGALWRERGGSIEKINLYFADEDQRGRFCRDMAGTELHMADSLGVGYEISPREATKALGLEELCRHLGVPVSAAMAVGDGGNDLDIMRAAGFSVAMGNAVEAVKSAAGAITDDCDHDGAARAVARYLLGEG